MLKKLMLAAALAALMSPSEASAYGAAHVGYTHVGPNGVYHTGKTVAAGPNGAYATGHTTAAGAGGAAYHSSYQAGRTPYGGAAGGSAYRYTPGYGGGAAAGGYHYGYVR